MQRSHVLLVGLTFILLLGVGAGWLWLRPQPETPVPPVDVPQRSDALTITVSQSGFYQISQRDLEEVGFELASLDPTQLALSDNGQPVPYWLSGDKLLFYGQGPPNRYVGQRVYLLEIGQAGQLINEEVLPTAVNQPVTLVPQQLYLEQNDIYDSRARQAENWDPLHDEPWYWATIQVQQQLPLTFELPQVPVGEASVQLRLWGATYDNAIENDHDFDLLLNERTLETVRWDGENHFVGQLSVPADLLQEGENRLLLDNAVPGATLVDIMRLDWIEIHYQAEPTAVADRFTVSQVNGDLTVTDFSDRPLLFNLADPTQPTFLTGGEYEAGQLQFTLTEQMTVTAIGPQGFLTPDTLQPARQSDWRNPANQADMLLITTDRLAPALEPLVAARKEEGLQVAVVPIAEIYAEFGHTGPVSLHQFVQYAATNWAEPAPTYLFLVGEATYDYRDYLGQQPTDLVPSLMIPVNYSGETVSDTRLADIDGDFKPDLAVGRWPVAEPTAVAQLVERTLAYEQTATAEQIIVAADGTSAQFGAISDRLLEQSALPQEHITRLYGQSADQFVNAWNEGAWFVTYTGHGSLDRWGKEDVFTSEALERLGTPQAVPIVLQLTCLTGFFAHPEVTSLSEAMLVHPQGPVLIISATSLTLSSSQEPFGINLMTALQDPAIERIGQAVNQAKRQLDVTNISSLREVSDTFGLLGDPSAHIVRPSLMAADSVESDS